MLLDAVYLAGKEFGLVTAAAARTFIVANIKHFVHTGMKSFCLEYIANLVDQRKNYRVQVGVERTVTFAIKAIGVGPVVLFGHFHVGGFVELRINL